MCVNAVNILRGETIIGHLPDSLAEKVAHVIRNNLIELMECEITGESIPVPEGVWVQGGGGGGGIHIPCKYRIYGKKSNKRTVEKLFIHKKRKST